VDRRKFLKSMLGAVATVAIATKLAPKFPEYRYTTHEMGFKISRESMEEQGKFYAEALARSMRQTKEHVAARIFWDNETDFLHVEGITAEEMYERVDA